LLHHGVCREVYALELLSNTRQHLAGAARPGPSQCRPASQLVEFWKERWLLPRATRDQSYLRVTRRATLEALLAPCPELLDLLSARALTLDV
jgi:hypothetical protein